MTNRPFLRLTVTLGIFVFFLTLNAASRQTFAQSCDKVTDDQMVSNIYARIKADKSLATQLSHINVSVLNQVVKLQGWTNTQRDFDKAVDIATTAECVRMINKNLLLPAPPPEGDALRSSGGCTTGTKPCGDICIPEGDTCNSTSAKP